MTYLAKTAVKRVAPAALTEYVTVIPNVSTKLLKLERDFSLEFEANLNQCNSFMTKSPACPRMNGLH